MPSALIYPKSFMAAAQQKPKAWESAISGVVQTGGDIAKGTAGFVAMATQKSADALRAGNTPKSSFVPITDRYKDEPWYKRIPKQVGDALTLNRSDPEVQKQFLRTHGEWSAAVNDTANKVYADATKTQSEIKPNLGNVGEATHFASSLIPGVRAMDVPLAIGAEKSLTGGAVPALAAAATRKFKGGFVRSAAQQLIGNAVN